MSEEPKYRVTLDGLTFYAYLYRLDEITSFLRLGTLSSGASCVEIEINNNTEFILLGVQFDTECTISKNMERGDNTRVMVNATIQLLKTLYPECKKLKIQDSSHFICPEVKYRVSLANNNFLRFGQTWYQRHFKARFSAIKEIKNVYNNAIKKLKEKPSPDSKFSSWHEYFQSLTCNQLYKVQEKYQRLLAVPDLNNSNWVITSFLKNKTIKIERDDSINLQSGGFGRMEF